jgi:WD40 repeat protein
MKVSTPAISWHNRERISSVDFQPICYPPPSKEKSRSVNRIASGGDDKHVVIWDISVAEQWSGENKNECGKVEPVCLCDLSRHQNTVNIVRWSPNGQILASGDSGRISVLCLRIVEPYPDFDFIWSNRLKSIKFTQILFQILSYSYGIIKTKVSHHGQIYLMMLKMGLTAKEVVGQKVGEYLKYFEGIYR